MRKALISLRRNNDAAGSFCLIRWGKKKVCGPGGAVWSADIPLDQPDSEAVGEVIDGGENCRLTARVCQRLRLSQTFRYGFQS